MLIKFHSYGASFDCNVMFYHSFGHLRRPRSGLKSPHRYAAPTQQEDVTGAPNQ